MTETSFHARAQGLGGYLDHHPCSSPVPRSGAPESSMKGACEHCDGGRVGRVQARQAEPCWMMATPCDLSRAVDALFAPAPGQHAGTLLERGSQAAREDFCGFPRAPRPGSADLEHRAFPHPASSPGSEVSMPSSAAIWPRRSCKAKLPEEARTPGRRGGRDVGVVGVHLNRTVVAQEQVQRLGAGVHRKVRQCPLGAVWPPGRRAPR